jgi:hypothetical protein
MAVRENIPIWHLDTPTKHFRDDNYFPINFHTGVCLISCTRAFKFKNTLFSLGMFTYTYERQDITLIALKRLPGGRECRKKRFVRFSPLHVTI